MSAVSQENESISTRAEPVVHSMEGWNSFSLLLPPSVRSEIVDAYSQERSFTNLSRLGGMWMTWLVIGGDPGDRAMIYSIAYHAFCNTSESRFDNYRRSALAFSERADKMGVERATASDVIDMILSQMTPLETVQPRCIVFSDVKLSCLASSPEQFRAWGETARAERALLDTGWKSRIDFFEYLKGRKVFRSGLTPAHWELRAQANVLSALADGSAH